MASLLDRMETFRRQDESVSTRDPLEERREKRQPSLGENREMSNEDFYEVLPHSVSYKSISQFPHKLFSKISIAP